jgi:hypothetical protein
MKKKQLYTKEWNTISWNDYYLGCCDCRLVHKLDFRVIGQTLQVKIKLCPKLTKEARKNV